MKYSDPIAIDKGRTDFLAPDGDRFDGKCFTKWYDFYTTPVMKFHLHKLSYFLFLMIFGHFLMTDNRPERICTQEVVIWTWVLTLLCDELRQIVVIKFPTHYIADRATTLAEFINNCTRRNCAKMCFFHKTQRTFPQWLEHLRNGRHSYLSHQSSFSDLSWGTSIFNGH